MNACRFGHRAAVALICILILAVCIPAVADDFGRLYEGTFPVGSVVLPMNGNQPEAGRLKAYGLAHYVLTHGAYIYRIIQAEGESAFLKTDQHPGGANFFGGPIIVLPKDAAVIQSARDNFFPTVALDTLQAPFYSDKIFPAFGALNIGVVRPLESQPWLGRTDVLLDTMNIPYSVVPAEQVEAGCSALASFDLVVDDCVGWFPFGPPSQVIACFQDLAAAGKEIIFTDLALADLMACFPGMVTVAANAVQGDDQLIDFDFHNNGDFVTQYSGLPSVPLSLHAAGAIMLSVSAGVNIAVDSHSYPGYGYGIAAAYFRVGKGIVEAFAYHPTDQTGLSFDSVYAAAALYGNKFIEGTPAEPRITLAPLTAVNQIGTTHTVTATVFDILGQPKPGVAVTFDVIAGPHSGAGGTGVTGPDGRATFTYTGTTVGEDTIVASFAEQDVERVILHESNKVYKTWTSPPPPAVTTLYQAYPGDSNGGNTSFAGNAGTDGEVISAVPGVLKIVPGDKWRNYVKADPGKPYGIKAVTLLKEIPEFIQCTIWNNLPDVKQRHPSGSIRLWWPLMYEAPGTKWTLQVTWVYIGEYKAHTDTWTWTMEATLDSVKDVVRLFHELPYGTCEVPLISDEILYPQLLTKLQEIKDALPNLNLARAKLLEFEDLVGDHCIYACPLSSMYTDVATGRLGITNTSENPACCKLLVDAEYVGFKLGIFGGSKR